MDSREQFESWMNASHSLIHPAMHLYEYMLSAWQEASKMRDNEIERLRDEVRELKNDAARGIHTCHNHCRKFPGCARRTDLFEALEELYYARSDNAERMARDALGLQEAL